MRNIRTGLLLLAMLMTNQAFAKWVKLATKHNDILNVRISDVAKHRSDFDSNLEMFSEWMDKNEDLIYPAQKIKKVHNLYLTDLPSRDGVYFRYDLTAFIELEEGDDKFQFVFFSAVGTELEKTKRSVKSDVELHIKEAISIKNTSLSVEVALSSRKAIVKDKFLPIKMVFPLGVGAFDESVLNDGVSIITPRFKNGFLNKDYAMYEREMPRYYMGKPFIRLHSSEDLKEGYTGIGFHAQPNGDEFIRAFDSHGCMRMQDADLYAMYWIVNQANGGQTPIVVNFNIQDRAEHPFPKRDKPYKTVLNTGKKGSPDFTLDIDDLVQLTNNYKISAPVSELKDNIEDDVNVIFDYDMWWRVKEKREGKVAACKERFQFDASQFDVDKSQFVVNVEDYVSFWMSEDDKEKAVKLYEKEKKSKDREYKRALKAANRAKEKAMDQNKDDYSDCIKNIRKKRSLKDKLYRWWVHGK